MKHSIKIILGIAVIAIVTFVACNSNGTTTIPEDLDAKKTLLAEKQSELRDIQNLITQLEDQIKEQDPPKEKEPIAVKVMSVKPQTFKRYIDVQANVVAEDVINVSSEMGGRITGMYVDEGDYVRKGQLLVVTDVRNLENQIIELETGLSLANTVFERQERLWKQNIGSEIQYLEAKNNKERIEKSLATLRGQIAKKNLYAPINGVVDIKFLDQGEMASPGMPILQLLNTQKIKIKADLQESLLGKVKKGDKVDIYFPALNDTITETISLLGRTIDRNNRTFTIEMNSSSRQGLLKPNLLAQVKINDYTKENAIAIPSYTIKEEVSGRKYVFVAREENGKKVAKKSYIELGEGADGLVVIETGIQDGDELVIAGGGSLTNNDPLLTQSTESNDQ
ncbi:MAG: efflux RND transporter periplasmic adaptor subunit [Saprospiraceae bacterium]|nr:efflux RND transporter periplasmic adaptor subunit [Saprospiraceae bacterium]